MNFLPANRLRLYRNFKALDGNDHNGIIRYYEQFEDGISSLDFEEYFDCTLVYTNALFQSGHHGRNVVMCDHLLELIIMQNIETWGGEDLYATILFQKAASLYNLDEYARSEHVLRELIKIYPNQPLFRRFLEKCLLRRKPSWLSKTRAATVALVLLSAIVIALEIFVVKPFFEEWYRAAQITHNVMLVSGIAVFASGEMLHALRCRWAVISFTRKMVRRNR
ncbi:MAG: hypothetical protein IPK76_07850 [Lewinellaceae bacterium]|jgi:tetratricopeptide (TPR) repeat protein|nr:hypothetical protein [Lewinellaceae bacterium]